MVGIGHHLQRHQRELDLGEVEMPRSKQEASRAKQPALASQYRAIGPAAIAAALLHTPKSKKPAHKITSPRAA
ncbi:hypothetical protein QV13_19675 [Mesorhizobium hungaricum]|uniref:Uncharacterized protein n=1 Tax=Mesorhizobium hungaricum TaxID=1566387 RepID=A0A1C2DIR7_9HYPH|nr:hypothetical protein QV13_19675 [Mesorhizobium hungaricum]